jgi:hypothetical protein
MGRHSYWAPVPGNIFGIISIEISKIEVLTYIDETLREICPIVNHVWTSFTKTI